MAAGKQFHTTAARGATGVRISFPSSIRQQWLDLHCSSASPAEGKCSQAAFTTLQHADLCVPSSCWPTRSSPLVYAEQCRRTEAEGGLLSSTIAASIIFQCDAHSPAIQRCRAPASLTPAVRTLQGGWGWRGAPQGSASIAEEVTSRPAACLDGAASLPQHRADHAHRPPQLALAHCLRRLCPGSASIRVPGGQRGCRSLLSQTGYPLGFSRGFGAFLARRAQSGGQRRVATLLPPAQPLVLAGRHRHQPCHSAQPHAGSPAKMVKFE